MMRYLQTEENPLTSTCHSGTAAYEFKADFILGISGGSPLDASKAIAVFASNRHMVARMIYTAEIKNTPCLQLYGHHSGNGQQVTAVSVRQTQKPA